MNRKCLNSNNLLSFCKNIKHLNIKKNKKIITLKSSLVFVSGHSCSVCCSCFKHNSQNALWGLWLKQDTNKRLKSFMHVYDRKLADIAGWKSHKILDTYSALTAIVISLPLLSTLSHPFSVSCSHILSLAPIGSFSHSHVPLEVSKSLPLFCPCEGQAVTRLVISHSSFPRPAS